MFAEVDGEEGVLAEKKRPGRNSRIQVASEGSQRLSLPVRIAEIRFSVIDDSGVLFQYFFGLIIHICSNFMDVIFMTTAGALHPHLFAGSVHFKFC